MNITTAELFNDSYQRCLAKEDFIDRFYDKYIASSEIVAQKFAHADMKKQKLMLEASLHLLMALKAVAPGDAKAHFKKLGAVHSRKQHDIAPELYDLWLACLIDAVKECDEKYDSDIDAAWRETLSGGIKIMQSMY